MERPVAVVYPGADEIRQHIVAVGGADQLPHRQPHPLGVVAGQNIAEIPRGHAEIHWLAQLDLMGFQQVAVGGNIVNHLRKDAPPIDGVGGGKEISPSGQLFPHGLVRENPLHTVLRVVKVTLDGAYTHVFSLLSRHLQLLNFADPVFRIEYQNLCLVHAREPLHGGLARIAGGCHQNAGCLFLPGHAQASGQQLGQHLQGHVLESAGRSMPKLQAPCPAIHLSQRSYGGMVKFVRTIGVLRELLQVLWAEVLQEFSHDVCRPALIGHAPQRFHLQGADAGKADGSEQSPVPAQTHGNGLGCIFTKGLVSGA